MDALVARQAIFDRDRRVHGYELLFRSNAAQNEFDGTEASLATRQVLANSLLVIGLENLVGTKKAFVNFGRVPCCRVGTPHSRAGARLSSCWKPSSRTPKFWKRAAACASKAIKSPWTTLCFGRDSNACWM